MMLTSDAFLSGAGEMDRLRIDSLQQPASSKKANTENQGAASEVSFPQALKNVQDAAGVSGTAAEAEESSDVSSAAAVAKEAGEGKALDGAVSKKEAAEDEDAQLDALYANLFAGDAVAVASEPVVAEVQLEADAVGNFSSIITSIEAGIEDASPALPYVAAEAKAEDAEAVALDERGFLAKNEAADEPPVNAEKGALDVNLSSINIDESEVAVASASDADALEVAFAVDGEAAQPIEAGLERAALAQEGEQNVAASGNAMPKADEEAPAITVADFRTANDAETERPRAALRNSAGLSPADNVATVATAGARADSAVQFGQEASFEEGSLLGKEGFNSSGSFSLQGARGGEGAASAAQGTAGASFAERLASELRNNAADIVRAGQIILRNGGEGTIRLALHPETLGAVRIHLEMTGEKKIAGRITVASREAWDAFSDSMDSLVAAFSGEGFDTGGGFDLSWAGRGAGSDAGGKISAPFYASAIPDVMPSDEFADDYSRAAARRSAGSLYSVNLLA